MNRKEALRGLFLVRLGDGGGSGGNQWRRQHTSGRDSIEAKLYLFCTFQGGWKRVRWDGIIISINRVCLKKGSRMVIDLNTLYNASLTLLMALPALCILPIFSALKYRGQYKKYAALQSESGLEAKKWMSPLVFGLIILVLFVIVAMFICTIYWGGFFKNAAQNVFSISSLLTPTALYYLTGLLLILMVPIFAALIYKGQLEKYIENNGDRYSATLLSPLKFCCILFPIEIILIIALFVWLVLYNLHAVIMSV